MLPLAGASVRSVLLRKSRKPLPAAQPTRLPPVSPCPKHTTAEADNVEPQSCELVLCPRVEQAFSLIGKRWTGQLIALLLLRDARFSELARAIPGLSERMLAERLKELEEHGLVNRTVDPGPPVRVLYGLTRSGHELEPAIAKLREWAEGHSSTS